MIEQIKCPHCGERYFSIDNTMTTLLGWTPVYKNGQLINKNPNHITYICHCKNCDEHFAWKDNENE